jgi:hypothetical protein
MLGEDLLAEFEQRLRSHGVPAIDAAQPGLGTEAINAAVSPLGLSLPREARVWWGWRNGVAREAAARSREMGPGRHWLPIEEAATECARIRDLVAQAAAADSVLADALWSPTSLPLVHYEGLYVIDAAGSDDGACPVRVHWFDEPEAPNDLGSIGDLVSL